MTAMYMYTHAKYAVFHGFEPELCRYHGFESHLRQLFFSGEKDASGEAALHHPVSMTELTCIHCLSCTLPTLHSLV